MACPFFIPSTRFEGGPWPHPARLPLGAGWRGSCAVAAGSDLPDDVMAGHCNLGYARCVHLPNEREADAVRFSVASASGARIRLSYVLERDHRPVDHGTLEFVRTECRWIVRHPDEQLQRMAICYVEAYLARTQVVDRAPQGCAAESK